MKIGKKFNELSKSEYFHYIDNHKKYTDFNTLGLYRSIGENGKLSLDDKIEIRDYTNQFFEKTFNFFQLKDPETYFAVTTLGQELTNADERAIWDTIRANQQKILSDKKIKHRNFGNYSKHNCGYDDCFMNGVMVKQDSLLGYGHLYFQSDKNKYAAQNKSERVKKDRKQKHRIILEDLENE
ncbi:hypothetical protein Oweho_0407 [Owenweeksia hongkongensis DSM 17368]|uniref:Uncharacterized protein n=1 Tax=Owenweeksia hongkongensis (strain DSM 17368 / CIP 108786 / JCM 12287 / NRRL B-23963 / UST20020801) TaxID=926562 RepID=G8QZ42_OWEHD|nr:hypothetical protein [Owenweeksia hongkongensis]AEV31425.1 hypothetical protein Oweho_0407 [Owenweeksia hongkongensis DSM 17368]